MKKTRVELLRIEEISWKSSRWNAKTQPSWTTRRRKRTFLLLDASMLCIMKWRRGEEKSKQNGSAFALVLIELCLKVHSTFELGWAEEWLLFLFFFFFCPLRCCCCAASRLSRSQCVGVSLWSFLDFELCWLGSFAAYYRFFMPMCVDFKEPTKYYVLWC